jgi:acyl-CoA-binding protein
MSMTELAFKRAAEDIKLLDDRPDNATLLKLYALFKQASEGDVAGEAPATFDLKETAKYNAWKAMAGTSKEAAMQAYIDLVADLRRG